MKCLRKMVEENVDMNMADVKTRGWFVALVIAIAAGIGSLTTGCARETASNIPEAPAATATSEQDEPSIATVEPAQTLNSQLPQTPITASAKSNQSLPVPNLIPPTSSTVHVPQSEIGRSDPFATILVAPTVSFKPSSGPEPVANTAPVASVAPPPTLPSLPTVQTAPITEFPPVSVPNLPPPQRLSETIAISGVMEVGGRTSVIVRVPNEHSSRYVHVGDYMGNGQVLVKRVEMGTEPMVVLEEDGSEVTRYVGSGSSMAGLL